MVIPAGTIPLKFHLPRTIRTNSLKNIKWFVLGKENVRAKDDCCLSEMAHRIGLSANLSRQFCQTERATYNQNCHCLECYVILAETAPSSAVLTGSIRRQPDPNGKFWQMVKGPKSMWTTYLSNGTTLGVLKYRKTAKWLAPQTTTRYKPKSQYPLRTECYLPLLWYGLAHYFFPQSNICSGIYLSLLKHPTEDNTVFVLAYDCAIYLQSLCPVNRRQVFAMSLNWKSYCFRLVFR